MVAVMEGGREAGEDDRYIPFEIQALRTPPEVSKELWRFMKCGRNSGWEQRLKHPEYKGRILIVSSLSNLRICYNKAFCFLFLFCFFYI